MLAQIPYRVVYNGRYTEYNGEGYTDPRDILNEGQTYNVKRILVHAWNTEITLQGIDGIFNSLWFDEPIYN